MPKNFQSKQSAKTKTKRSRKRRSDYGCKVGIAPEDVGIIDWLAVRGETLNRLLLSETSESRRSVLRRTLCAAYNAGWKDRGRHDKSAANDLSSTTPSQQPEASNTTKKQEDNENIQDE
jgi:hypothetical protein